MDHMGFQMPGSGQQPMMNQPPMFGSYQQDGMPNMGHMPDMTAHMFSDAQLLMEDTNDAKRRRIARVSESPAQLPLAALLVATPQGETERQTQRDG